MASKKLPWEKVPQKTNPENDKLPKKPRQVIVSPETASGPKARHQMASPKTPTKIRHLEP
jgi:hypothetical protein